MTQPRSTSELVGTRTPIKKETLVGLDLCYITFVIQKKFKLRKVKKQRELLTFCNVIKNNPQDTYKQRVLKLIKSDTQQNQRKIFQNKSVKVFFRNIKRFFKINLFTFQVLLTNSFSKIIHLENFLKRQPFFKIKFITISNFIGERFFLKNSLLKFHELSTDFILKKGLEVLKTLDFIRFETPINKGSQGSYFYKCLKKTIRLGFLDFFSSKIIFTTNCQPGGA